MLSRIIVNSYKQFIEIALWLSLLIAIVVGWQVPSTFFGGLLGVIVGIIVWFIMAVVFFGAFLVLEDIRERVKNIEGSK